MRPDYGVLIGPMVPGTPATRAVQWACSDGCACQRKRRWPIAVRLPAKTLCPLEETRTSTAPPSLGHAPGMLLLSRITGQEVLGPDGRVAGRVADLTVRLDEQAGPHLVERLLVRRHRAPDLLVPWAAIESFENTCVLVRDTDDLTTFAITSTTDALDDDEILLVRDVLDTQIVDLVGQRLARVADVVLTRTADDRLELVGAEVGFGGVLRRLGLRRLAARDGEDCVAWTDLHLTSERGHAVQLATPRSAVHHLDAAALAALVSRLDTESAAEVLTARGSRVAADVVRAADPAVGERMLWAMPDADAAKILAAMPARARDPVARPPRAFSCPPRKALHTVPGVAPSPSHADPRQGYRGQSDVKRLGRNGFSLGALLAVVGPGLLAGLSDDDPAGITTYSVLGADHGYQLLWVLLLSTIALVLFHGLAARMGVVTGQGLIGLVRQRYGVRLGGAALAVLVVANVGTTCAEFAGIAAGAELFGISRYASVPAAAVIVSLLVLRGSFHRVEHFLLLLSTVFLAYIASGVLAHPDWGAAFHGMLVPSLPANSAAIAIVTATVGTTLAPWGLSFIQSYAVDKKLRTEDLSLERVDVITGAVLTGHYRLLRRGGVCGDAAPRRPFHPRRRRCRSGTATAGRHRGVDIVRRRPDRSRVPGSLHPAALDGLLGMRVRGHRSGCGRSVHRGQALLPDVRARHARRRAHRPDSEHPVGDDPRGHPGAQRGAAGAAAVRDDRHRAGPRPHGPLHHRPGQHHRLRHHHRRGGAVRGCAGGHLAHPMNDVTDAGMPQRRSAAS